MGNVLSGLLGGGNQGSNFQATQVQGLMGPTAVTNEGQQDAAYGGSQAALANQSNFVNALQGQNGIGNQSNVYNQLGGIAAGTGANPAQAMLNQATTQNIQNAASTVASQKGINNPGMAAREAGMIGANTQQQTAGQAATMQANQSLNALGQQANIAGQQVQNQAGAISTQNQAQQGFQGLVNTAAQNQNANLVSSQNNANSTNAQVQSANAQAQNSAGSGILSSLGSVVGLAHGGQVPMYADGTGNVQSLPSVSGPQSGVGKWFKSSAAGGVGSPIQSSEQQMNQNAYSMGQNTGNLIGKGISALGNALGLGGNQGQTGLGSVTYDMPGGKVGGMTDENLTGLPSSNQEMALDLNGGATLETENTTPAPAPDAGGYMARGGQVPAMVSPGEKYLDPREAKEVASGKKSPMKAGETIKGKAKVKGDSLKNDTVQKNLEEGGVVIPRSVMNSKDPKKEAARFVAAHLKSLAKGGKV